MRYIPTHRLTGPARPWLRIGVASCLTMAVIVTAPASAAAAIVVGEGAKGLKLGDTGTTVKSVLGKPRRIQKYAGGESWFWKNYWITLTTRHIVRGIETRDPGQKTSRGIGPGSSTAALKKAYPGVKCKTSLVPDLICTLSTSRTGKKVRTGFVIFKGKVSIVDIGTVGDFG